MFFFFFNATATTEIYTLSLHVALPIWNQRAIHDSMVRISELENRGDALYATVIADLFRGHGREPVEIMKWKEDRKSTRLNSSHSQISYAVFCLQKKTERRAWRIWWLAR